VHETRARTANRSTDRRRFTPRILAHRTEEESPDTLTVFALFHCAEPYESNPAQTSALIDLSLMGRSVGASKFLWSTPLSGNDARQGVRSASSSSMSGRLLSTVPMAPTLTDHRSAKQRCSQGWRVAFLSDELYRRVLEARQEDGAGRPSSVS
jgi:hypothetical protein